MELTEQIWTAISNGAILPDLGYWSYVLIAVLVAMEGSVTILAAAALVGSGTLDPWLVFLSASIGNAVADAGWYWLGRLGHFDRLTTRFRWFQKFEPQIAQLDQNVTANAPRLLFAAKVWLWAAAIPTLIAVGMAQVSWRRLLPVVLIGETVRTGGLVLAGAFLGHYITQIQSGLQWVVVGGSVAFVLALPSIVRNLTEGKVTSEKWFKAD